MAEKLNAVKGMNDILPPESARWEWLEATVRDLMGRYATATCARRSSNPPRCSCAASAR
jgi:histidyl-tRNA synthetase